MAEAEERRVLDLAQRKDEAGRHCNAPLRRLRHGVTNPRAVVGHHGCVQGQRLVQRDRPRWRTPRAQHHEQSEIAEAAHGVPCTRGERIVLIQQRAVHIETSTASKAVTHMLQRVGGGGAHRGSMHTAPPHR